MKLDSYTCRKVSSILGATITLLPNGVSFYWGTLSTYVMSYIVVCLESTSNVEAPWTFSLFVGFWTLGLMLSSSIGGIVGLRKAAVLGLVMTDLGIVASYFAVQSSFVLLNLTLAVVPGFGTGLLQAHCLRLVIQWADKDTGFLMAISQGSFFWGASVILQLSTLYINPPNDVPDVYIGHMVYFSQKAILDKVPSFFLVLGCFSVGCHVIGFSLLRENTFDNSKEEQPLDKTDALREDNNLDNDHSYVQVGQETTSDTTSLSTPAATVDDESSRLVIEEQRQASSSSSDGQDYTPRQVLRSTSFYALWTVFLFSEYPYVLHGNYYKSYGQVHIHDDFFFADLGTVMSFSNIFVRILWGIAMDKMGVKNVLTLGVLSVILVSLWFYFTAIVDKWFYFIVSNVFTDLAGSLFGSIPVVAVSVFGKSHFSANYGLLRSSSIALSLVCPLVAQSIFGCCGFFYLFASSSLVNVISLVLILFFLPKFK